MTVFIHITSFTKNDKKYGLSYIYDIFTYMRVYVGKTLHLFYKISHIQDNTCIKSVTFGPSQQRDPCFFTGMQAGVDYSFFSCHCEA